MTSERRPTAPVGRPPSTDWTPRIGPPAVVLPRGETHGSSADQSASQVANDKAADLAISLVAMNMRAPTIDVPLRVGRSPQSSHLNRQFLQAVGVAPHAAGSTAVVRSRLSPDKLYRLNQRGQEAETNGDLWLAEQLHRRAWAAAPHHPGAAIDVGSFLYRNGRPAQAIRVLKRALELMPADLTKQELTARTYLGQAMLATGDYSHEAWSGYESRFQAQFFEVCPVRPQVSYPEWDGSDLNGARLLILAEQGLGDQIQFARFAPMLRRAGAQVTLTCDAPLRRLFDRSLGVRILPNTPVRMPLNSIDADCWVFTMSLAHRLGITLENLPADPYLKTDMVRAVPGARIGIVTKGNPEHKLDHHRSLPDDLGRELLQLEGAISLRPEDSGADDFDQTAEIIAGLDLVITVDTSVAHLAGAMGKPVWILLSATGTDWRWMQRRTDSPWYPSAKLYRQEKPGDWASVIDRVKRDLRS